MDIATRKAELKSIIAEAKNIPHPSRRDAARSVGLAGGRTNAI